MKATHKTQIVANPAHGSLVAEAFKGLTLIFLGISTTDGFTPEAQEVLDILDRQIASAQAGQASRDAFLESLDGNPGCGEWEAEPWWKKDPVLRAALKEACPGIDEPKRRKVRAGTGNLSATQGVRPREGTLQDPALSAALHRPWGGVELAATGAEVGRRRLWLQRPGWALQAGRLAFDSPSSDGPLGRGRARLPRLDFVAGRQTFAGWSARSGIEGPLSAHSSAPDGLGVLAGGKGFQASAFGSWNRLVPAGGRPAEVRRDALAHSLMILGRAGDWHWAGQALHERLEVSDDVGPATALVGGAEIRHASGRYRLGLAGSGLWRRGFEARADPGAGASLPEAGAYGQVSLSDGKQEGYHLELRQAGPGWANPLADIPTHLRDTLEGGLILPGRGEGGLTARSRLEFLQGRSVRLATIAAGEAAWVLDRSIRPEALQEYPDPLPGSDRTGRALLAGDGRVSAILEHGPWSYEAGTGLRWRKAGLPAPGGFRTLAQSVAWKGERWRVQASLSRRSSSADREPAWPASLDAGYRSRGSATFKAGLAAGDALNPTRAWRLSLQQAWKVGEGASLSHVLRLPWEAGDLREDMGYQFGLVFTGL